MLHLLRQRNYGLLWFGQLISVGGDWALGIALPFYVYALTGSTLATGVMFIVNALPRILLGSLAGVFVDRWDRKRTMIAADLARAVLLLPLLLVRSPSDLWILYAIMLIEAAVSQFFGPAEMALLPRLVPGDQLVEANSLNSLGQSLARLLAPTLGGVLFAWQGLGLVVLVDSVSFLFSALMLALIVVSPAVAGPVLPRVKTPILALWNELLAGLRVVGRERLLWSLFAVWGICMVSEGVIEVLLVPFVRTGMRGDAVVLGWMMTAQAAGNLLGGSAVGWLGQRISPTRWIIFGMLGWGVLDLGIFNIPYLPAALALFVLVGIPLVGLWVSVNVVLQQHVADEFRGRVFGSFGTTTALMTMIGMGASSLLGDRVGIVPVLNAACALLVAVALVSWLWAPLSSPRIQAAGQA